MNKNRLKSEHTVEKGGETVIAVHSPHYFVLGGERMLREASTIQLGAGWSVYLGMVIGERGYWFMLLFLSTLNNSHTLFEVR